MEELAATIRDLPLHRYPMARCGDCGRARRGPAPREGLLANGWNEVLTPLLRRTEARGGVALMFEPT